MRGAEAPKSASGGDFFGVSGWGFRFGVSGFPGVGGMGLSIRAYAARRGVSHTAVRKALAAGRISALADGTIDPDQADKDWAAKTDPALQRGAAAKAMAAATAGGTRKAQARQATQRQLDALEKLEAELKDAGLDDPAGDLTIDMPGALGGEADEDDEAISFTVARTRKEILQVKLLSLKAAQLEGSLVDREKATAAVFDLARRERDAWLSWPARVGALLAGEFDVDPHAMEQALGRLVREHMAELAEPKVELR